jgi:predicted NBD/HSP70 family sugar kinase
MTTIALADLDARFVTQESLPTARDPEQFIAEVAPRLRNLFNLRPEITYEGIGVSLPGRIDAATQRLVFAPNLGWRDADLKTPLEKATGLHVELENAANACALAEIWFARRTETVHNLVAVTVSEGIGVGVIVNGQLLRGSTGVAGEFGHITIVEDGLQCACGNRGCWEMYASNSAPVRYYAQAATRGRSRSEPGPSRSAPSFDDVLRLAEQGDAKANEAFDQMAHYLGCGIAMLVSGLAPDVVVVVGEVTRLWNRIGPSIKKVVESRVFSHASTRIVPTDPSAQPRLRGTIALILQKHFGAPAVA